MQQQCQGLGNTELSVIQDEVPRDVLSQGEHVVSMAFLCFFVVITKAKAASTVPRDT